MSIGKVLLGALAGAAMGSALGVLLAPEKGKVTRRNISNKKDDYLEDAESKLNQLILKLFSKYDDLSNLISKHSNSGIVKKDNKMFSNGNR